MFGSSFRSAAVWAAALSSILHGLASANEIERHYRASYPQKAPRAYARAKSRYMPHQGKQEMARRVRQMEAANG